MALNKDNEIYDEISVSKMINQTENIKMTAPKRKKMLSPSEIV